jgi:hypothetical protein
MDEQPSSTLSGFLPGRPSAKNSPATIEMVFRFWCPNARAAEPAGSENASASNAGILALIEDAVASKRGIFRSSSDQVYVSGLQQPADALVVSRQVQLGLQGFRGKRGNGPVAVSIAIDASGADRVPAGAESAGDAAAPATSNTPSHDLVTLLKLSKPAQVLLTHDLCQQMAEVKGLPLKSFPGRFGVYEYLWTAEDKLDLLQSEPQLTLTALPLPAAAAKTESVSAVAASGTTKAFEPPRNLAKAGPTEPSPAEMVQEAPSAFQMPRALIFGAVGLVVFGAAIAVGVHLSHGSGSAPAVPAAPVSSPQPSLAAASPSTPVAQPTPPAPAPRAIERTHAAAKPSPQTARPAETKPAAETEVKTVPAPQPASPSCTLPAPAARLVALAEQSRGHGDYANAARIYREVLACEPNNDAAKEGLEKANRALEQH